MTRKSFFAALLALPATVFAAWRAKSAPASVGDLAIKIRLDTAEFDAAMQRISVQMDQLESRKFEPHERLSSSDAKAIKEAWSRVASSPLLSRSL